LRIKKLSVSGNLDSIAKQRLKSMEFQFFTVLKRGWVVHWSYFLGPF